MLFKSPFIRPAGSFLLFMLLPCFLMAQKIELSLDGDWQFRKVGDIEWLPATVPGTVHTDLLANGKIDDPYYRTNEDSLQWIDKADWEYQLEFELDEDFLNHDYLYLNCEGLDTYADVFVNDLYLIKANNMFRQWGLRMNRLLKPGTNTIRVYFHSPTIKGLIALHSNGYGYPAGNDQSEKGGLQEKKVSVFTRKAPYHYGWDWGPRLVTSGIWKPITLSAWNQASIANYFVETKKIKSNTALVDVGLEIKAYETGIYEIAIKIPDQPEASFTKTIELGIGVNNFRFKTEIKDPKLWWTNGLGEPYLYDIQYFLKKKDTVLDSAQHYFGIRTIEVVRDKDSIGQSFYFKLNGVPVFMKGANYIPNDVFVTRVSNADYEKVIGSAQQANMNMLRVWGGGIYEYDTFYELCDKYGIMVWQDFMFACSMYPGDDDFLKNIKAEAAEQVRRLKKYPCIALWCGNNEIDVAWAQYEENKGWGWKQQYDSLQRAEIWHAYDTVFHHILPQVVKENDNEKFYWPSSPMADYGELASYNTQKGDIHYWGVWHGEHRFEAFDEYIGRFMSEYGFQSFPEFSTVKKYTLPEDWDIESTVMAAHQRSGIGNLRIQQYMEWYLPVPEDFEGKLYMGQVLQAEAIKRAIEAHRGAMPHNMGTLYWQLNDCWPVASWSGMDYYKRWKAMHYFVKKAYQPILVRVYEKDGEITFQGVSDLLIDKAIELRYSLFNFEGKEILSKSEMVNLPANTSSILQSVPFTAILDGQLRKDVFLKIELVEKGTILADNYYFFTPGKDWSLPKTTIDIQVDKQQITLTSDQFAAYVFVDTQGKGHLSDNYFHLMPGEKKVIQFEGNAMGKELEKLIKVMSLGDF
ncbi:MAG: glycoside hydrolase family 2 protein [Saprospiraceae bacterium]|nr:glycoside hydrolase family 2 protein [Saprospiraceae bacterium]